MVDADAVRINVPAEPSMYRITFAADTTIHDSVIDMTYQLPENQRDLLGEIKQGDLHTPQKGLDHVKVEYTDPNIPASSGKNPVRPDDTSRSRTDNPAITHLPNENIWVLVGCLVVLIAIVAVSLGYLKLPKLLKKTD